MARNTEAPQLGLQQPETTSATTAERAIRDHTFLRDQLHDDVVSCGKTRVSREEQTITVHTALDTWKRFDRNEELLKRFLTDPTIPLEMKTKITKVLKPKKR